MSAKSNEFRGRNVEEAVQHALQQLKLTRDQVDIQVLHEGTRGLLGIRSSEAVVRVTPRSPVASETSAPASPPASAEPKPAPPSAPQSSGHAAPLSPGAPQSAAEEPARAESLVPEAPAQPQSTWNAPAPAAESRPARGATQLNASQVSKETLEALLKGMGLHAQVVVRPPEPGPSPANDPKAKHEGPEFILDIVGSDLGVLIGRRGETLRDLEFMTRLIIATRLNRQIRLSVDVEGYRLRRERLLRELAKRMAERVKQNRQPITLEAMPPNERRIVHITLRESNAVRTESIGEGDHRRVMILPK